MNNFKPPLEKSKGGFLYIILNAKLKKWVEYNFAPPLRRHFMKWRHNGGAIKTRGWRRKIGGANGGAVSSIKVPQLRRKLRDHVKTLH